MKYTLPFFFVLLSLLAFSCSDEEEAPTELRLVKETTTVDRETYEPHPITYNNAGLMTLFREFPHTYDHNNRLLSVTHFGFESFSYDSQGRIASVHYLNGDVKHTFIYDAAGRMVRVHGYAMFPVALTYDEKGNVTKEETIFPYSGAMGNVRETIEIRYDNMKNPMQGKGSPSTNAYISPTLFLISDMKPISSYNFISYYSPNNPVEIIVDGTSYPLQYKYNEQGYPVEVRYKNNVQKLEYAWQ